MLQIPLQTILTYHSGILTTKVIKYTMNEKQSLKTPLKRL